MHEGPHLKPRRVAPEVLTSRQARCRMPNAKNSGSPEGHPKAAKAKVADGQVRTELSSQARPRDRRSRKPQSQTPECAVAVAEPIKAASNPLNPLLAVSQPPAPICCLTPRSRRGPTASHQAREAALVIIRLAGLASCRRPRLTSNVRRHQTRRCRDSFRSPPTQAVVPS